MDSSDYLPALCLVTDVHLASFSCKDLGFLKDRRSKFNCIFLCWFRTGFSLVFRISSSKDSGWNCLAVSSCFFYAFHGFSQLSNQPLKSGWFAMKHFVRIWWPQKYTWYSQFRHSNLECHRKCFRHHDTTSPTFFFKSVWYLMQCPIANPLFD